MAKPRPAPAPQPEPAPEPVAAPVVQPAEPAPTGYRLGMVDGRVVLIPAPTKEAKP